MKTKPLSPHEFQEYFRDRQRCMEYLFEQKYPDGYKCPRCGHGHGHHLAKRGGMFQCGKCHYQESAKIGTVMQGSKIPLVKWFRAFYEVAVSKRGVSALELKYKLGVGYETAWRMLMKIRDAMGARDAKKS